MAQQLNVLAVGTRVHCILYGGKDGTVTEIRGESDPSSCGQLGVAGIVFGGPCEVDIVWDDGTASCGIPEALLRGSVQWKFLDQPRHTAEQVASELAHHALCQAQASAKAAAAAAAFRAECERLKADHPHLVTEEQETSSGKRAATNIRRQLKARWPREKFSVRSQSAGYYRCIDVRWTDGPRREEVEAMLAPYKAGRFNAMEDIYESESTPWNAVFGSANYVDAERDTSDTLFQLALDKLYEILPNVQEIPKPPVTQCRGYGESPQVPHLNHVTINELVAALAQAYDAVTQRFFRPKYARHSWLIEMALESEVANG